MTRSLLFFAALAVGIAAPTGAQTAPVDAAQQQAAQQQAARAPLASQPVPGDLELAKLIWSTLAAIDHANQAGNYSVLRDLSSPGFQAINDSARLTVIFNNLRQSGVDLSNTLLLSPTYDGPAAMIGPDLFRVRGYFGLRPTAIGFDLIYQWVQGRWKLNGVSITPATMSPVMPTLAPPPPAAAPRRN